MRSSKVVNLKIKNLVCRIQHFFLSVQNDPLLNLVYSTVQYSIVQYSTVQYSIA